MNSDTDGGLVDDGVEIYVDNSNPIDDSDDDTTDIDQDGDGLTDGQEYVLGTDKADADSDDDGLNDGDEVNNWTSDPLDSDSDGDGLNDGLEDRDRNGALAEANPGGVQETDPTVPDTDGDGLCDAPMAVNTGCQAGEDRTRNGYVDPQETDPKRTGAARGTHL